MTEKQPARVRKSAAAKKGASTARRRRDPLVKVEQQRTVVRMWTAGHDSQAIADELGVSTETVRRVRREALTEAIADRDVEVTQARETELRRLDALMSAWWRRAFGTAVELYDADLQPILKVYDDRGDPIDLRHLGVLDIDAAKVVLKCVVERSKLLGLYAPVKVDAKIRSELDAEIESLIDQLGELGLAKTRD